MKLKSTPVVGSLARRHRAADPDPDAETLEERPEGIIIRSEMRPGRRRADDLDEDEGPDLEPPGWARP